MDFSISLYIFAAGLPLIDLYALSLFSFPVAEVLQPSLKSHTITSVAAL